MTGFIFGGDTGMTYEALQRKRKIAEQLMQGNRQPRNALEGLGSAAQSIAGALLNKKMDKREGAMRDEFNTDFSELFGGEFGGGQATPASAPTMSQNDSLAMHGGPTNAAAAAVGAPIDFSAFEEKYELPDGYLARTAQIESDMGRNMDNPNSSAGGPFQFIDSTARQYGLEDKYDWTQSTDAASRLAKDNAAALSNALGRAPTGAELYLAHQQGAGGAAKLLANPNARAVDIVGADAVRLNGGDANMTAGEFASKWTNKFGNVGGAPAPSGGGSNNNIQRIAQIAAMASNPLATPAQKAIAQTLLQRELQQGDPMRQMQMEKAQLELEALRNPTAELQIEELADGRKYYVDPIGNQPPRLVNDGLEVQPEYRQVLGADIGLTGDLAQMTFNVGRDGKATPIGGAQTVINNNMPGEDKFNDAFAKGDATALATISDAGMTAQRNMGRIEQLESLLTESDSGFVANAKLIAGEFGINTEGLDTLQSAQAIINSLVPEQRQPGSGPMSDADLDLFKQSLPRLINQPGGNQTIINAMRGIAQYDAEGAAIVQQLRSGEIVRAQAFEMLQNRVNPLEGFSPPPDTAQSDGAGPPADTPAAPAELDDALSVLEQGFQTRQGNQSPQNLIENYRRTLNRAELRRFNQLTPEQQLQEATR